MRVGKKGGAPGGQDSAEVVVVVETDRCGDSQETDNGPKVKINVIQDFLKPVAKRAKLGQSGNLQTEINEMKFWALKVPGHEDKFLGVDLGSIGFVTGINLDEMRINTCAARN